MDDRQIAKDLLDIAHGLIARHGDVDIEPPGGWTIEVPQ